MSDTLAALKRIIKQLTKQQKEAMFAANPTSLEMARCSRCMEVHFTKVRHSCKINLSQIKAFAEQRGGQCLSTEYVAANRKLTWKCAQGHIWEALCSNVGKKTSPRWCNKCSRGNSAGEAISRSALQHMWPGHLFQKERPSWLLNTQGKRLELDGVNHELKIAFEYDGKQHTIPVQFGSSATPDETLREFLRTQEHDAIKTKRLFEEGYLLLRVPHTVKMKDIYAHLSNQCIANGKSHPLPIIPFNHGTVIVGKQGKYLYWSQYAFEMGGSLLSLNYCNSTEIMEWRCASGHDFKLHANNIQSGKWCGICAKARSRITLEELHFAARLNNGTLISTKYSSNCQTHLEWQCSNGHVFFTTVFGVLSGRWCPTCAMQIKYIRGADEVAFRKEAKALRIKKMRDYRLQIKEEVMNSHKRQKRSAAAKASANSKFTQSE